MRCLITGVAGFIGSTLADTLLADGHEVTGIDCFVDYYSREIKERNLENARSHDSFSFIECDLRDAEHSKLLEGVDWVFHQAAQAGVRASWGTTFSIYTENNIRATQLLLEAATKPEVRNSLKKIVFASSSSVYGNAETLPTTEQMRPEPVSPYGVTKLASENLMLLYAKEFNVPTVSLRYFTVYGPRQRPDMAFHKFLRAGIEGEGITVYGTGEQTRDFTFIEDIVRANIAAAEKDTAELVYNIGGGSRVSLNHVIDVIGEVIGTPLQVERVERQKGDAQHTGADISLAARDLAYAPKTALKTGLTAEFEWLKTLPQR